VGEMRKIAVILARSGSKRLENKNRLIIDGRMLFEYTLDAAIESEVFSHIIISTDDGKIAYKCKEKYFGEVWTIKRPKYLANETAPSEECVLHAVSGFSPCDWVMLLQPTSPLRTAEDIRIVDRMREKENKSIYSVDECTMKLNGAIYYMKLEDLLRTRKYNCELHYYMPHERSIDIDTIHDLRKFEMILTGL
jgi:CMP-N-acetylneuraminic acid synthetase